MEIPKYREISADQETLRELFKTMKDPEPITETYISPDGQKVERVLTDVLHPEALSFWTKMVLPPIPATINSGEILESSPRLKSQPSPSSELENPINDTADVSQVLCDWSSMSW